jgi:hypothetical protein
VYHDYSCCRDKVNRAAGRCAVVMVFALPLRQLYHDGTTPAHLSGLSHLDSFIWTRKLKSIYQDFAKTHANPDTDGNFPYHRPLGFIAGANQYLVHLRKFIMIFYFRPPTGTQSFPNFILTCPACPTLLANNNSRFCFLKYTKPAHEHYLQVLPMLLKPVSLPSTGT